MVIVKGNQNLSSLRGRIVTVLNIAAWKRHQIRRVFPNNNCVPSHSHQHYHHINIKCHVHHIKSNHSTPNINIALFLERVVNRKGRFVRITYMNISLIKIMYIFRTNRYTHTRIMWMTNQKMLCLSSNRPLFVCLAFILWDNRLNLMVWCIEIVFGSLLIGINLG